MNDDILEKDIIPTEPEEEPIPIDSTIKIKVDDMGYEVSLMANAPVNGGAHITSEQIQAELSNRKITVGIRENVISSIVNNKQYDKWFTVASAISPVDGEDAVVEYFFDSDSVGQLVEDDRGFVDFKDLNIVKNIYAGTPIAKLTPETTGTPGSNVYNRPIAQRLGRKLNPSFSENIALSKDGVTWIATKDGHLYHKNRRFGIQTVFTINGNVDVSTGNISFIGDIIIKGDVSEGFTVKSDKSIVVYGSVYAAKIEAQNKIDVRKGVIGSTIIAGGEVKIEFAEKSDIKCNGKLTAKSMIFCRANCVGDIFVNTGPGSIIGGEVICARNLFVNNLGSNSYAQTQVSLGENAVLKMEKEVIVKSIPQLEEELDKCNKIVEFLGKLKEKLGDLPEDKKAILVTTTNTIALKKSDLSKAKTRIDEIDVILQTEQVNYIECKKDLHPGVRIIINDFVHIIDRYSTRVRIYLGEDGVVVNPL